MTETTRPEPPTDAFRADLARIRQHEAGHLGGRAVRVAVLDGPIHVTHACFTHTQITQLPAPRTLDPDAPAVRHGTHVASLIACSDPAIGIAPEAAIIAIPIFGADNTSGVLGGPACTQGELAAAIHLALHHGADIINVSAGQLVWSSEASWELEAAIAACEKHGVLVVAAAGNDGCACVHVPAAIGAVLAVGAMDRAGQPLPTSNHGAPYHGHALLAPGEDLRGAAPGDGFAARTGTSFATAVVSGVAALLLGIARARNRPLTAREVGAALLATAAPCFETPTVTRAQCLAGRLDITRAYERITQGELTMSTHSETIETPEDAHVIPQAIIAPLAPIAPPAPAALITPSNCGCGGAASAPRSVFTFGELGYDFATDTRRDLVASQLATGESPYNTQQLLGMLGRKPNITPYVTWLLRTNETPLYALAPEGPYAAATYDALLKTLGDTSVELVSIAGVITGKVQLSSGAWVDLLAPVPWAIYSWSTTALVDAATKATPSIGGTAVTALNQALRDFLTRIYYERRNRGETPDQRALNYAVTNIFQFTEVFAATSQALLRLDNVQVTKSPMCRPGSDCYDVQAIFFSPAKRFEEARRVYQFTVDVSDVVPVQVGSLRTWALS